VTAGFDPARFGCAPAGRPLLMGVINVTPDSFSDGGLHATADAAIAHGRSLAAAGADILDVGGESTRPGAAEITAAEEAARILPVIEALAGDGFVVSVDTRRARVMEAALARGARIVNDVTALSGDRDSLAVVARSGAPTILMHMQGEPATMQVAPRYDDVVREVGAFLAARVAACAAAGIDRGRLCVDPGIGFGKTVAHNLALLRALPALCVAGCGLLVGASRKAFIGKLSRGESPPERVPGSIAVALHAAAAGADILRVHDVAETRQALEVWRALQGAG
jgi:dihydropteroate synthase